MRNRNALRVINPNFVDRDFVNQATGFNQLHREIDRLFDDLISPTVPDWRQQGAGALAPACDVEEKEDHFLVSMDLPGVPKDSINIEISGNQLHVSAERKEEHEEGGKKEGFRLSERRYGRWERFFTLPDNVDPEKVEAHYQDGVLRLAVPKSEVAKPRQIKVGEGKGGFISRLIGKGGEQRKEDIEVVKGQRKAG